MEVFFRSTFRDGKKFVNDEVWLWIQSFMNVHILVGIGVKFSDVGKLFFCALVLNIIKNLEYARTGKSIASTFSLSA